MHLMPPFGLRDLHSISRSSRQPVFHLSRSQAEHQANTNNKYQ